MYNLRAACIYSGAKKRKKNSTNANILFKFALVTFWKSLDKFSSYSCFCERAGVISYGVSLYIFSMHVFIIHVVIYFLSNVESLCVFVFTLKLNQRYHKVDF